MEENQDLLGAFQGLSKPSASAFHTCEETHSSHFQKWIFSPIEVENTPSHACGMSDFDEKSNRRRGTRFIRHLGERLNLSDITINTAKVIFHRFYMYHSFLMFDYIEVGSACIFAAAKSSAGPKTRIKHIVRRIKEMKLSCFEELKDEDIGSKIIEIEDILLPTIGFDLVVDLPHTYVLIALNKWNAPAEVAKMSLTMATTSLIRTRMCLRYRPSVIACLALLAAANLRKWEIPGSREGKDWCQEVDPEVKLNSVIQLLDFFEASCNPNLQ